MSVHYGVKPYEAGYVSRLSELRFLNKENAQDNLLAGVMSVPWSGEGTSVLLDKFAQALDEIDVSHGDWKIYMNLREAGSMAAVDLFDRHDHIRFEQVGPQFLGDLCNSRSAVIYGGYNSLTDVMVC